MVGYFVLQRTYCVCELYNDELFAADQCFQHQLLKNKTQITK